jgi:hypothetical protein
MMAGCGQSSTLKPEEPGDKAAPGKEGDTGEKQRKPKFTVSKETTYATGPLDKDGYIDYAAALNQWLSQGVTPDNNANILFWKAIGPSPGGKPMPPEFFERLGVEPPPDRGEYYTDLDDYLRRHSKGDLGKQAKEIDAVFDRVTERPWTAKQYPQVAAWLKANQKPLALVVEGTRRSRYFSPLVPQGKGGLIDALMLPGVQKCRDFAFALNVRAMLHIGDGRYDEAWQDLLACHRLGRLVSKGSMFIEDLVALAIDNVASSADLVYLDHAKLNAKQVMDRLKDLRRLPPMSPVAEHFDLGERLFYLDNLVRFARSDIRTLDSLVGVEPAKATDPLLDRFLKDIDWDPALRTVNRWYDRMAAAMRLEGRPARQKALDQIDSDIRALKKKMLERAAREIKAQKLKNGDEKEASNDLLATALLSAEANPETRAKTFANMLVWMSLPQIVTMQQAGDRAEQTQRNLYVTFALAAYKADHERYPMKLEALAPKYLAEVPGDLFSGKPLIYRPSEKGYLLYSVGVNGMDEQGRSYGDDPPGDDLVVRMPLPEPPRNHRAP